MPDLDLVLRDDRGPIVRLTLNCPDRRNALSRDLVAALAEHLDGLANDSSVRVLILTGAGSSFCAGMDLKEAATDFALPPSKAEQRAVDDSLALARLIDRLHRFPRLTIAAVNGPAFGGGAGLAMACDALMMSETARIGYPEVVRGLVAAIVLPDLVRQVGERRARTLLLTGHFLSATEALQWGLANQVCAPDRLDADAWAAAARALEAAPEAVVLTKRLIDEASGRALNLDDAAALSASVRVSEEGREGLTAFQEKRRPLWAIDPTT